MQKQAASMLQTQTYNYKSYVNKYMPDDLRNLMTLYAEKPNEIARFEKIMIKGMIEYSDFLHAQNPAKYQKLVYNELTAPFIMTFARWFCQSPNFVKDQFQLMSNQRPSLHKGLLLLGSPGSGKSYLFKCVQELRFPVHFKWVDCVELPNAFKRDPDCIQERYISTYSNANYTRRNVDLMFDDIGDESQGIHFGQRSELIREIMKGRERKDMLTHGTSNMTLEEIGNRYGEDVLSRFRSMFNIITLPTQIKDWRS